MERTGVSVRRWAKTAAVLIFVTAVSAVVVGRGIPQQQPPLLLSLEFATSADEIRQLIPPLLRDAVLRAQRADSWLFIPSYWALFVATGLVMRVSGGDQAKRNRTLGLAVIVAITLTAAFDYFENAAIAVALEPVPSSDGANPRPWAIAKWLLLFVSVGLVAAAVGLRPKPKPHAILTAALLAAASALGIVATLFARDYIQPAVGVMAVGLLLLALLWIWSPAYLARSS
jgi:hypothetical protein